MRRNDRAIPDFAAMLAVVRQCDCCRLGLVENGEAYIVPLNFGWEAEGETLTLYFHGAAEGRKLALLRQNPAASFEMDTACCPAKPAARTATPTARSWGAAWPSC